MGRIVYVNGAYVRSSAASVHFEDRGYQFADGVYEVILVRRGQLVDADPHLTRLERSLRELEISAPMSDGSTRVVLREIIRRNAIREGFVYLQMTRGAAPRDHVFPAHARTAFVCSARKRDWPEQGDAPKGVKVATTLDERWARCDVKSISLLPNILAKEKARAKGAAEAIFVSKDGIAREGGSSNLWIVDAAGALHTHPLGPEILGGVTRKIIAALAGTAQITVHEAAFSVEILLGAKEAFITSATSFVKPVIQVDEAVIGDGAVGAVTQRMFDLYVAHTLEGVA